MAIRAGGRSFSEAIGASSVDQLESKVATVDKLELAGGQLAEIADVEQRLEDRGRWTALPAGPERAAVDRFRVHPYRRPGAGSGNPCRT
jgi:hypothetical protein